MKRFLIIVGFLIFIASAFNAQTLNQQKVGYVDSQVMLSTLPEAIKAQGELDKIAKGWYAKADSMTTALQGDYATYQKQQGTMSPEKLKDAQQAIVNKEQ